MVRNSNNQSAALTNPYFGQLATETLQQIGDYLDNASIQALVSQDRLLLTRLRPIWEGKLYVTGNIQSILSSMKTLESFANNSSYQHLVKTLKVDLLECRLSQIHHMSTAFANAVKKLTKLNEIRIHMRGFNGSITARRIDDMARTLSPLLQVCGRRVHVVIEALPTTPTFDSSSGPAAFIKCMNKYIPDTSGTLGELTCSADTTRDASCLLVDAAHTGMGRTSVLNLRWNIGHRYVLERVLEGAAWQSDRTSSHLTILRLEGGAVRVGEQKGWPDLNGVVSTVFKRDGTLITFLQPFLNLRELVFRRFTLGYGGWGKLLAFYNSFTETWFKRMRRLSIEEAFEKKLGKLDWEEIEIESPPDTAILFRRAVNREYDSNKVEVVGDVGDGTFLLALEEVIGQLYRTWIGGEDGEIIAVEDESDDDSDSDSDEDDSGDDNSDDCISEDDDSGEDTSEDAHSESDDDPTD